MGKVQAVRGYVLEDEDIQCPLDPALNCFECPFPRCIAGLGPQVYNSWVRRKRTKELHDMGYTVKQIARELGVTEHTINRYKRVGVGNI